MTQAQAPVSPTPAAKSSTGLFRSQRSRILLAIIAIIVVLGLIAWFIFQQNRAARSAPMAYDAFPGATLINKTNEQGDGFLRETLGYSTPGTVEKVMEFYTARYGSLSLIDESGNVNENGSDQGCQMYKNGDGTTFGRCIIDNSQDDQVQRMLITVNTDTALNQTVIQIQRDWAK
ncbi:MAG: hypothetical protein KF716_27330 [Anaerolineae bacterium]|nr:hypothetical protein [Anaerolineae bacterium]